MEALAVTHLRKETSHIRFPFFTFQELRAQPVAQRPYLEREDVVRALKDFMASI